MSDLHAAGQGMSRWDRVLIAMYGVAFFLSCLQRYSMAVLGGTIAEEFSLSGSQFAMLGAAIFYPYAILQIPSGYISDRVAPRTLMIFSGFAAGVGAMCFASASTFETLVIGRLLTGFGTAFIYMPALALLRRTLGDARYGSAAGLFISIGSVGSLASSLPMRLVSDVVGWHAVFWTFAVVLIVMGAAALFVLPKGGAPARGGAAFSRNVFSPGFMILVVWFLVQNGASIAFSSLWGGRFYSEVLALDPVMVSVCLFTMSIGNITGSIVSGRISDKLGTMRTIVITSVMMIAAWTILGRLSAGSGVVAASLVSFFIGCSSSGGATAGFAAVKLFVPPEDTGFASGLSNGGIYIGSAVFSQVSGMVIGTAQSSGQFPTLFAIFSASLGVTTAVLILVNRKLISR